MAVSRVRSRAGGIALSVEVEGFDKADRAFRDVRRRVARELAGVEKKAAETTVLPAAKAHAGGLRIDGQAIPGRLVITRSRSSPALTTSFRGTRAAAAGLLEFGGTVRAPIIPKHAKALTINGEFRSIVRTARHYRARRYLQQAAQERVGAFGEQVRDEIVRFFGDPFEIT